MIGRGAGRRPRTSARRFVVGAVVALGLLVAPVAAGAQPASGPTRLGFLPLGSASNPYDRSLVEAFRHGLRDVGLIDNRDVALDVVWVASDTEYPRAAGELVQRGARVLIPAGTSASLAAKGQSATLPIVFVSVGNPVGIGLVDSLARPGRNATGVSDVLADLSGKYVEVARDLSKRGAPIDYLWYAGWADGQPRLQRTEQAAQSLGVKLRPRQVADVGEVNEAMAALKKSGATTVIIQPSPFTFRQRERIIEAATRHGLATVFGFPPAAREGGLAAYGPDYAHLYRRAASYVDRVLKGTKPADLPVEEPTKFELVINLKTAKALGLAIPQSLLTRADEIVQ